MKQILLSLSAIAMLGFAACSNNETKTEETTTDTTAAAVTPEPPAFQPFTVVMVQHKVGDFDKWLPAFEGHDSARKAAGLTDLGVGRVMDSKNDVIIGMKADDVQKAKDFANSPGLKEAMKKAGVVGAPTISYLTVIRDDNSTIDQKDRLMVKHHVKNFDAWLKVYDAEGKQARAEHGLIDRGIAQDIDDPNTVYVLFAVTDVAKAKARAASPELKKIMEDAGVDGPPTAVFYTLTK